MIKRVLLMGAGAAAGWMAHSVLLKGRDTAALKAEEALRTTLAPENIGRQAGQAAATALAAGARSFTAQLREEVPAWRTAPAPAVHDAQTIPGTVTDRPDDHRASD